MLKVINPATEALVKELETDSVDSLKKRYDRAKLAQVEWAKRPFKERAQILSKFSELLLADVDRVAKDQSLETGKPISQAKGEVKSTPNRVKYFVENFESTLAPIEKESPGMREVVRYEPLGVIVNISAWNYPWFVGVNVFAPALLAGNAVLYKPSEFSPLTGKNIERLLHEAGVPKDCFQAVIGDGALGAALLDLPINGVFFTGSYGTGAKIAQKVASKMIRIQLELGGKDPVYICDDVDVKPVAEGTADGAFYNNGQSCCSVERIYVHEKVYDKYVENFVNTVKGFKMGDPLDESTYLGPLTRKAQIQVLKSQIQDAVKKGAKILTGGNEVKGKPGYFEPTVLVNVTNEMEVMREESFGPVIGIQKVSSDEEALALMNDTDYGLTAGVYTRDEKRAEKMLSQLNAGSAYWNCCDRVSPELPWTGRKHSGIGSTLSRLGIMAFVQPKGYHLRKP
ncbi:MAG: aldehyde dehydrogenase family protein [Bdellovibrionales bacterium]|nr:aldehyde dehydrogenase family protein [Bdellovibrionales bacterium]